MTQRLYLLPLTTVFAARVNTAEFTYPLNSVEFDTVTTGAFGDILPGMTALFGSTAGGDDLGRQRIRAAADSNTVFIGRSSRGVRDGEVDLADNAHITILNDFRVWSKIPYIDDNGVSYKDEAAYTDQTDQIPPKANITAGWRIATIDSGTSVATFQFIGTSSYAAADGASLSTYLWDVGDGTITVGTSASNTITATFPAGKRWVSLTVTDSNGKSQTMRVLVVASPLNHSDCVAFQCVEYTITRNGQSCAFDILEDIPATTYPDGTAVIFWDGEPADDADSSNVQFWGWHNIDSNNIVASRTGTTKETVMMCLDIAGRLHTLPAFPQSVQTADSPASWLEMKTPNMDKYIDYVLRWHSTAFENARYIPSGTGAAFPFVVLGSDGDSIWDQAQRRAAALVPDYALRCNRNGALRVLIDPQLQDVADRTAVNQATLTAADYSAISWERTRPPRFHWHRGNAIKADANVISALFCIAPGTTPGQGESEQERGEQLAQSQDDLNACEGHRYALINAVHGAVPITLIDDDDRIDPADMTWVTLTAPDAMTRRGLGFSAVRGMPLEMTISYDYSRTGVVKTPELIWEEETSGTPAVTYIPPPPEDDGDDWPDWEPDPVGDPGLNSGQQNIVGINTDGYIYKTSSFQTTAAQGGPVWSRVGSGMSGTIYSFSVDPFSPLYLGTGSTVNGWVATSTNIYFIEDLFNSSPTVNNQHTFSTAITPATGRNRTIGASFGGFSGNTGPAYVMVISHYGSTGGHTGTYSIFSGDGGTTWGSEVLISSNYDLDGGWDHVPGLYHSPKYDGKAYTAAHIETNNNAATDGYITINSGASWNRISNPDIQPGIGLGAVHVPWPDNAAEDYVYHGWEQFAHYAYRLYRVNGTTRTDISPTGSDGRTYGWRYGPHFGCKTFDQNRAYVVFAGSASEGSGGLGNLYRAAFVSSSYGGAWTEIVSPSSATNPTPNEAAFAGDTPNVIYLWGNNYMSYSNNFPTPHTKTPAHHPNRPSL